MWRLASSDLPNLNRQSEANVKQATPAGTLSAL
jgi:hypothetical protein